MGISHRVKHCCLCQSEKLSTVCELGSTPLANNLPSTLEESISSERFDLALLLCEDCKHVQLRTAVNPEVLFSDYSYKTGVSVSFLNHFRELGQYVDSLMKRLHPNSSNLNVIDIGCNDGTLLDILKEKGYETIGVDPARNLVENLNGHKTYCGFFGMDVATQIVRDNGHCHLVTANNVFAHTRDIVPFAFGVWKVLSERGLFVFEVQYLPDMIKNTTFDMIYHEHTSYHHITPIKKALEKIGFSLFDATHLDTHGGSVRLSFLKSTSPLKESSISEEMSELMQADRKFNTCIEDELEHFSASIHNLKQDIASLEKFLRHSRKRIYGYSAPAKAVTLTTVFSPELLSRIEFIVEDNDLKQGKFLPGSNIPIISGEAAQVVLNGCSDSICVIFAWNVANDIIESASSKNLRPSCFIVPLPSIMIL